MFSGKTTVETEGPKTLIMKTNLKDNKFWKLRAENEEERDKWVNAVREKVSKLGFMEVDYENTKVDDVSKESLHTGFLSARPKSGNVEWEERFFMLTESELYQFEVRTKCKINPSS